MIRTAVLLGVTLTGLLSGCVALPPAIVYLSYAKTGLDLLSVVETDKTLTDHALSIFMDEDCSLLRVLSNDDICTPLALANADIIVLEGRDKPLVSLPAATFGEDGRLLLQRKLGARLQNRPVSYAALSDTELSGVGSPLPEIGPGGAIILGRTALRSEAPAVTEHRPDNGFVRLIN